jgi:cytoskeleton protein RodZ
MSTMQAGMESHRMPPPPPPTLGPGARLKAARQDAGLSVDQVAQQLKLAPRQVRALEDDDFAQLPGRTFARGFVRNYARLLNLDGDDLIAQLPDAAQTPALAAPSLHSTGSTMGEVPTTRVGRSTFGRWLIPLVLLACVVGAGAYEWYRNGLSPAPEPTRTDSLAPSNVTREPASAAGTTTSALPNPLGSAVEPAADENRDAVAATAPAAPAATEASASAAAAEGPAPIMLSYRGPSWTEVRDRDGKVIFARLIAAGSEQSIRGAAPFDLVIGNAQNVTLSYLGKTIDLTRYTRQNIARLRLLP